MEGNKKAPASPKVNTGAISVGAVRVDSFPPRRTPSPRHKLRPRLIECKDFFYLDVDFSPFQSQDDDACSNEKNAKPLPSDWAFPEEQDRKESYEQEAQLIDWRDFRGIAHL